MTEKYILEGHSAIPCNSAMDWAHWFEKANRVVAQTSCGDTRVSTVFLGLDHSFGGATPLLFETMIFGGPNDGYQERCSTWEEAEVMHEKAVTLCKSESL
jgi:hypothetical protein